MSITDKTGDVLLFTPGRTPCTGPLAIVLHGYSSGIEMLDLEMERCPRPRPRQSTGCHTSFHYGVDGCNIHQYVALANTAWGFGVTPPTCPAPICPPDECSSCTGLTVAQYNPDLDGNDPVLPPFVAGTDGTANSCVIHVAVTGQSGFSALDAYGDCCRWMEKSYQCFVRSLCEIFRASGLTPSQTTLLVHCQELLCINIDQLVIDILACLNAPAPVLPPCNCTATTVSGEAVCTALAAFPASLVPATVALGPDCQFHPLPVTPPTDVTITGLDTATVDVTVTEGPANTFVISANVIDIPDGAVCAEIAQFTGSVVPATVALGPDCLFHPIAAAAPIVLVPLDTATVDITITESPLGTFTISADAIGGGAQTPITPVDTNTVNLTASGTDNHTLQADVLISATPGNTLVANPDGLFVPAGGAAFTLTDCAGTAVPSGSAVITPANLSAAPTSSDVTPQLLGKDPLGGACPVEVIAPTTCPTVDGARATAVGTNEGRRILVANPTTGALEWQFLGDDLITLGGGTIDVNDPETYPKFITVDVPQSITAPTDGCARTEIYIKNVGSSPITITGVGGVTMDGQNVLTLDGTITAGYPFGNDGGEAVHLVWSVPANEWKVF